MTIIVKNNIIPFPGYKAMALWPFIFCRKRLDDTTLNHERIHLRQQAQMLIVLFLLWYLVEWIIRSLQYRSFRSGYRNISFEREAYANQHNPNYLKERRFWEHLEYLTIKTE